MYVTNKNLSMYFSGQQINQLFVFTHVFRSLTCSKKITTTIITTTTNRISNSINN